MKNLIGLLLGALCIAVAIANAIYGDWLNALWFAALGVLDLSNVMR